MKNYPLDPASAMVIAVLVFMSCPFRRLVKHRHSVDNPSENPYLRKYNTKGYNYFNPRRNVPLTQRNIPLVGDEDIIESIDNDSEHCQDGGGTDEKEISVP
jgi:hypothetical protein